MATVEKTSNRSALAAGSLLAVGLIAVVLAVSVWVSGPSLPDASGDVGVLIAYGQTPDGPAPLPRGRRVALPRPQDIAFNLIVEGTGPRWVRVEVESEGEAWVAYEKKHQSPISSAIDFTMRFGEDAPDELTVVVTVEAPHAMKRTLRHPIRLVGANSPFWEKD